MTLVGDLDAADLRRRLARDGLAIATGMYGVRMRSDVPLVAEAIGDHYAHHRLLDEDAIIDVVVDVHRVRSWRRPTVPRVVGAVDPLRTFPPAPVSHAVPMIETALNLGTVATGMDILTLHAGVLERGGRALVMPGQSGSGKSTLTAALAHQGWRLLSDELALIRLDDGALLPLVRPISLKNASIDLIATRVGGAAVGRRHEGTVKGTIAYCRPPRGAVERGEEPAPCGWIVFPRYDADRPTAITPMDKIVAFGSAFGQSGNYRALGRPAFDVLTDLIDRCPAFALTFKDLDEAIACIDRVTAAS